MISTSLNDVPRLDFSWETTRSASQLHFTSCYADFECARLEVPLDRQNESDHDQVVLAIIRLPAKVPVTDSRYGGVVFLTPGGPGVPGIGFLRNRGKALQTILDAGGHPSSTDPDNNSKFYDVISIDPRGIGRTTPALHCFPDTFTRDAWNMQRMAEGVLDTNTSHGAFETVWARYDALGQKCFDGGDRTKIAMYMNTPNVVVDVLDVLERYGEWREKKAIFLLQGQTTTSEEKQDILERTRWRRGNEKLQYWGFSYGTVIGATLATMYPSRVHRLVLDGVVDTSEYYSVNRYNIPDADAIMDKFAVYCHTAGPSKCAFYTGNSAADITTAIEDISRNLREKPLIAKTGELQAPEIITHSDFLRYIFGVMYNPYLKFEQLAEVFANLKSGNGSMMADAKRFTPSLTCPSEKCKTSGPYSRDCIDDSAISPEAASGVACADGADLRNMTREEYKTHVENFTKQSRWMGSVWVTDAVTLACVHWRFRPKWEFHGPIGASTSFPILFISTTLDPVCPLEGAHIMAKRFPGSVVLEQDSEGHCSFSSPSLCTSHHISSYFQTGALPAPDTLCLPDARPFGLPGNFTSTYVIRKAAIASATIESSGSQVELGSQRLLDAYGKDIGQEVGMDGRMTKEWRDECDTDEVGRVRSAGDTLACMGML